MPVGKRVGRRTQAQRREQTGSALLVAAADLVVESGVRAVTLARVGERAGYSRGIVTHHFGSKRALLDALARATQSGFVPGLAGTTPGLERLVTLAHGYVGALGDLGPMNRAFLLLWTEALTDTELSDVFRERDDAFRADLRSDVEAGISTGSVRPDVEPHDVAVALLGQLRGIALQVLLAPDAVDTERLAPVLATMAPKVSAGRLIAFWFENDSRVDQNVLSAMKRYRQRGVPVFLATNQEHMRADYLMRTVGLGAHVDGIIYSAALGHRKPDARFFERAAAIAGAAPEEIVLVDDTLANVEAARRSGWSAVHWTGERPLDEELTPYMG